MDQNLEINPIPEIPESQESETDLTESIGGIWVKIPPGKWGIETDWEIDKNSESPKATKVSTKFLLYHHFCSEPYYPETVQFDHTIEILSSIKPFSHNKEKIKLSFIISIAIKPENTISHYWIVNVTQHLSRHTINLVLGDLVFKQDTNYENLLTDEYKKIKLQKYFYKLEKKLRKQLRIKWNQYNSLLINVLLSSEYII